MQPMNEWSTSRQFATDIDFKRYISQFAVKNLSIKLTATTKILIMISEVNNKNK